MNPAQPPVQQSLQLRDVHLPASPEFWPPAPGWWVLALLLLVLLGWLSIRLISYWRQKRTQQEIMSLLDDVSRSAADQPVPEFLASVSTLLRRVALMKFPRREVARLTGKDWLSFLDIHGGEGGFSQGAGRVLADGPYRNSSDVDRDGLLQLARKWIQQNTGASRV